MPWTATNEARRILAAPLLLLRLMRHGITWGKGWRIYGMPIVQRFRGSHIQLGDGLELRSWPTSNPLMPQHPVVLATRTANAQIEIGQDVAMTGTTLVAAEKISIGDRVLIGANTTIVDTDFHPLDPIQRRLNPREGGHAPVIIESDVFIGMHSLILKGVRIGAGSIVGAGSVVTRSVPSGCVVAGNPACIVRHTEL